MEDKEKEKESKKQSSFLVAISNTPDPYKCVRRNSRRNFNVTLKKAYLQFNHTPCVCTRPGHLKINAICQTFKTTTSSVSE